MASLLSFENLIQKKQLAPNTAPIDFGPEVSPRLTEKRGRQKETSNGGSDVTKEPASPVSLSKDPDIFFFGDLFLRTWRFINQRRRGHEALVEGFVVKRILIKKINPVNDPPVKGCEYDAVPRNFPHGK